MGAGAATATATDAPLPYRTLERLASRTFFNRSRRVSNWKGLGLLRTGVVCGHINSTRVCPLQKTNFNLKFRPGLVGHYRPLQPAM
jgi:hypothetical protein